MKEVIQKFRRSFGWQKKFVPPYPEYIKVFSHPRSGTHFLESFVGENFYSGIDLSRKNVEWGHWKNRQIDKEGFKYGKLFGSHLPPYPSLKKIDYPVLYIYRDGRAVAHSLYNSEHFIVPGKDQITFSQFLRNKIDWEGSSGYPTKPKHTIAQHWYLHVNGWAKLAKRNPNILILRYEDLIRHPYKVYTKIHETFFINRPKLSKQDLYLARKAVGISPNAANVDSWKNIFTDEDHAYFMNCLPRSAKINYLYE